MSSELLGILYSFQPDAPEVQLKRDYDLAAREFVGRLSLLNPQQFAKGADTPQDVLEVCFSLCSSRIYVGLAYTRKLEEHRLVLTLHELKFLG